MIINVFVLHKNCACINGSRYRQCSLSPVQLCPALCSANQACSFPQALHQSCLTLYTNGNNARLTVCSVSQKKYPPLWIFSFFHKRLRIFNRFFPHLLYVPMYAKLQIFIQLRPTLTKLCHIKRDYLVICSKCPKRARSDVCVSCW